MKDQQRKKEETNRSTDQLNVHLDRGRALCDHGQLIEAIGEFTQAIKLAPGAFPVYFSRAVAYQTLATKEDYIQNVYLLLLAMQDFGTFFSHSRGKIPDSDKLLAFARKCAFENHQRYDVAVQVLQQFLQPNTQDALVYFIDAHDSLQREEFEVALDELSKAIQQDSNFAEAYCGRGFCYFCLGKDAESVADFKQSIRLAPVYSPARQLLRILSSNDTDIQSRILSDPALEEFLRELKTDCAKAGFDDPEVMRAVFMLESATDRTEGAPFLFQLVAQGNRIIPLANLRAARDPSLRDRWTAVLVLLGTPEATREVGETHASATAESLESMATTDLIEIIRRESYVQQNRVRSIGALLAQRDASAHEAVVEAIQNELVNGSIQHRPEPFLCLMLAAKTMGGVIVPGLIRLLCDETLPCGHEDLVQALGLIGDARARPILLKTRDTWAGFGNERLNLIVTQALDEIQRRGEVTPDSHAARPTPDNPFFHFVCHACGKKLKAKINLVGRKVSCPHCNAVILVAAKPARP